MRASKLLGKDIRNLNDYYLHMHEFFDKGDAGHGFLMFTSEDGVINEEPLTINLNTRTISVPGSIASCAGVQTDRMAEMLIFEVDRFFDYMDLANSKIKIYVQWETPVGKDANGEVIPSAAGSTEVDFIDYVTKPGKILFAWPLTADIAQASGAVKFSVRFFKLDEMDKVVYSLNTQSAAITIKPALLSPDVKPNVITPLMTNMFESVILNSDAADGVKKPANPWFAFPGADISLLDANDKVIALDKVDSRYIANLEDNTLTFCVQAVTSDLAEMEYVWTYIPANAKDKADVKTMRGTDKYVFAGTEDYFSGKRLNEDGEVEAIDAPENERFYVLSTESATGYELYDGNFPVGGEEFLYERYSTYTIPNNNESVTGYYFATVTSAFAADANAISDPRESSRCELPGPQPLAISTNLPMSAYLESINEDGEIVDNAIALAIDTGANPYKSTVTYNWKRSVDGDDFEDISNNSKSLIVDEPGWYKVEVTSVLNRETATPVSSNTCFVTELPVKPTIENDTKINGVVANNIPLTAAAGSVVLKVKAKLPEGYDIANPLQHEKFNYKWYISLVNEGNPHLVTEADKDYAVANGNELTVFWNSRVDYASFNCLVENELNEKIATSELLDMNIFVDYK